MESDFKIEFIGKNLPFTKNDKLWIGDEAIRNPDVVWFERTGPNALTIHRVASYPKPTGVSGYRVERAPSGAIRYVQLDEAGVEFDEPAKATLKEIEKSEFKRPWWKLW